MGTFETIFVFSKRPIVVMRTFKTLQTGKKSNGKNRDRETMTARDVTEFYGSSSPGNRAIFSTVWGDFLTKLHRNHWRRSKNFHWRKIYKKKEKMNWRKFKNNPMETAPRNCRFCRIRIEILSASQRARIRGNPQKCSRDCSQECSQNRGALKSAPKSALEGFCLCAEQEEGHPRDRSREHS